MRGLLIRTFLICVFTAGLAAPTWAMGWFKRSHGSSDGGGGGVSAHHDRGSTGGRDYSPQTFGGLNTSVLPKDNPTNPDNLLNEIHQPGSRGPNHGPQDTEEKEQFERSVSSQVPRGDHPYAIPEPMSLSLLGMGLAGVWLKRRMR